MLVLPSVQLECSIAMKAWASNRQEPSPLILATTFQNQFEFTSVSV